MTTMEEKLYGFYQFPDSKNHWEEKDFLSLLVSRNVFKKGYFCQFLVSKIYDKIWHCFNIFCKFCISENFDISPVWEALQIPHIPLTLLSFPHATVTSNYQTECCSWSTAFMPLAFLWSLGSRWSSGYTINWANPWLSICTSEGGRLLSRTMVGLRRHCFPLGLIFMFFKFRASPENASCTDEQLKIQIPTALGLRNSKIGVAFSICFMSWELSHQGSLFFSWADYDTCVHIWKLLRWR